MQREIKFRAWDNVRNIMFYPDEIWFKSDLSWNCINRVNGFAICETDNLSGVAMQYTGITDKNGKEIYEGDVVNLSGGKRVFEIFNNCFWLIHENRKWKFPIHMITEEYLKEAEIIGNIYENPELLNS